MQIEKTKYERSDAITAVLNMASKTYLAKVAAIRAQAPKLTREAIHERIVNDVYAELKAKQEAAADRAFMFDKKVANGVYVKAPTVLIEAVKADHAHVRMARSLGDDVTMYKDVAAFKVARAWKYTSFEPGTCYAHQSTIDLLMKAYGLVAPDA